MTFSSLTIRSIAVATALLAAGASANAMTIGTNALVADSVQAFSQDTLDNFDVYKITVAPLGNASAVANTTGAFSFPITSVTVDSKLKISSGDAKGSALDIVRTFKSGRQVGLVLANFTINYVDSKVLADTTPRGGATVKQMPLYDFKTATPLALKYKFPLSITGHEVLNNLKFTTTAVDTFMTTLELPAVVRSIVETLDNGTLTQDIAVKFRPKAVSTTPYTPAP